MPKVSVIIPAFNQARFLREAVDSVLGQTLRDFEIIVVDDGSTDNTPEVAQSFTDRRVRYVCQENRGLAGARNTGIAMSSGEFIAFLDSDDTYSPHKLELQTDSLSEHPAVGLVASGYQYVDEAGKLLGEERPWLNCPKPTLESLLLGGLTAVHAVLIRRAWLERVGMFDASFRAAEDMDLWYRLGLAGCEMEWVPAIACQYRIHGQNMSRGVKAHYRALYTALDKVFASSELPGELRERRNRVYAQAKLGETGRHYGAGNVDEAKSCLRAALKLDPTLLAENDHRLAGSIAAWDQSVWARDRKGLLDYVLRNLPLEMELRTSLLQQVKLTRLKAAFYTAFETGDGRKVRRLWLELAHQELRWLLNRGSWSILVRSLN